MKYIALAFLVVLLPQFAQAAVQISEVAWMGTANSQYSEWLELYNDGESSVNLAGWKLYEGDGGTLVYTLTKSISVHGYLLIERTTASAPDAVPGINDEAGSFGGGGFANTGEDLVLKDSTGATVDELNFLDGWPAGDATTKQTMQWNGDKWVTADPTPKAGVDEESSGTTDKTTEEAQKDPFPIPKVSPNKPQIEFTIPPVVYRGTSYQFEAQPVLEYNFHLTEGNAYWNFGDGTTLHQTTVAPVTHVYAYPGTYTLYYSYSDAYTKNVPLVGIKKVRVLDPTLTISMVGTRAIELTNASGAPIDVSGWSVVAGGQSVTMPDKTIVSEKSTVTIPLIALGITSAPSARIIDPSGVMVAQTGGSIQRQSIAVVQPEVASQDSDVLPAPDFVAQAADDPDSQPSTPIRNRTKTFIFGAVALFVIGLSILLERAMARREYQ